MRLGLIARADNSGLGNQTKAFYDHMHPAKTMVVDISHLNGNKVFLDRYPDGIHIKGMPTDQDIDSFLQGLDVVFVAEAAYNFHLYTRAKQLGVKVANQYNYEFFDWFNVSHRTPPDMLIAPSRWHYETIDAWCRERGIQHIYLHCPVDRDKIPCNRPKAFRRFLHTAGRAAAHDRNGTLTVIDAAQYLRTDAEIIVHFQGEQGLAHQATRTTEDYRRYLAAGRDAGNIKIHTEELADYASIYQQGDVLLLPRRYGGNCLPMNEALAAGMPVIMSDLSPNNEFLPHEWLIPAKKVSEFTPRTTIDIYESDPIKLAEKIDNFYMMSELEAADQHLIADSLASSISWENMTSSYQKALEELCSQ